MRRADRSAIGRTRCLCPRAARACASLGVTLALVAGSLALGTASAGAVIVRLPGGRTLSYQPLRQGGGGPSTFDALFSNLDYNGGPVMPSNTNYAIYWQPSGAPAYPAEYRSGLDRYFEDLAHDSGGTANVESVSAQYNDASGAFASYSSHFGGALLDTDNYPTNGCAQATICLTDAQLQAELTKFVKEHGLATDLEHEYFLITPPGVEDCFTSGGAQCSAGSKKPAYCAYHSSIALAGGAELIYANDPYVTENAGCDDGNHPNGKPSDGLLIGGLSHEHNESTTDPEPNTAWTDFGGSGGENGDKCRTFSEASEFGTPLGEVEVGGKKYKYNQEINGHKYWYQQEWSNQGNACLQRLTFGGVQPSASFTWTAGAGNEVKFDASSSSAPGRTIVGYNWQFNEGGAPGTPQQTAGPATSHTFAAGGFYTVALTILTEDGVASEKGTSAGTAQAVTAGTPPLPAISKVTPAKGSPAGGASVTIKGSGFTGTKAVSFGSLAAASFTVVSSTTITAVAPESSAGAVFVSVTTPAGTSEPSTGSKFKFAPPTVASVTPNAGPIAGGTRVTVTGTGFAPGVGTTAIKFAGALATGVECSSHRICEATSPKHAAGVVEVRATVNKLTTPKDPAADQFTYS
jgi:PKD domain/IPT/TIG domain